MALKGDARHKLELIKRKKGKNNNDSNNVKDLRQLIAKKSKAKKGDRVSSGRINKTGGNTSGHRDLRDSNKKLAARKKGPQQTRDGDRNRSTGQTGRAQATVASSRNQATRKTPKYPQRQYYVPPHMQQQAPAPTYIIAPPAPSSNLAMDNVHETQQSASVLISNLAPIITQSEIIELFGDLGTLTGVNMINQTTALVTYEKSSDAVKAVKIYNNRFLDGRAMYVNMMPTSTVPTTSIRSRIGRSSNPMDSRVVPMDTSYLPSSRR